MVVFLLSQDQSKHNEFVQFCKARKKFATNIKRTTRVFRLNRKYITEDSEHVEVYLKKNNMCSTKYWIIIEK